MPVAAPKGTALAKLEGKIYYNNTDQDDYTFSYFIIDDLILLGRSDPAAFPHDPLAPAQHGIHVGLGDSNKLSRTHAKIQHDTKTRAFFLQCLGKNGLTATLPASEQTVVMTPDTPPVKLQSRTLIQMGESIFCFVLPAEYPPLPKKKRDWIKAETVALRALMMRLGYGRWDEIIRLSTGRLAERTPDEIIPVARRFVARCFIHARPGVEQKVLGEILREDFSTDTPSSVVEENVAGLIQEAKDAAELNEKRKFVRWARKLRLLRRLRDIHDHSSVNRLLNGQLTVFTPRPAPYWTDKDDVDLLLGTYKHGYGFAELIRADPEFGFHDRYLPVPSNKKNKSGPKPKSTPSTNGEVNEDDHEGEDEEEHDEEEDTANGENGKKIKKESTPSRNGSPSESIHEDSDSAPSVKDEDLPVKSEPMEIEKNGVDGENKMEVDKVEKTENVKMEDVEVSNGGDKSEVEEIKPQKSEKTVFPSSEALMKRLKSVINTCAKEFERDVRAVRKQTQAQNRAQKRKDDLEQRRKEKAAERMRKREERKIAKSQPFSKKDALEFEKALSNFGLEYKEDGTSPDWEAFTAKVPQFRNKYFETLEEAFADFNAEAHRKVEISAAKDDEDADRMTELEKQTPSTMFTQLTLERAERVLERLSFFRTLRGEVLKNPAMSQILRGCKRTRELPMWWKSGHDKSLLSGVDKYGFNAWDNLAKDEALPFHDSIRQHEDKYAEDPKTLKKGTFPKPSAAAKRAHMLVQYFRSKAMDPHYQQVIREANGETRNGVQAEKRDSEQSGSDSAEKAGDCNGREKQEEVVIQQQEIDAMATPLNLVDSNGHLVLPAVVGEGLFLLELGEILQGDGYHTDKVLFPVGYRAVRQVKTEAYLCEIRPAPDGNFPLFRVSRLHGFQTHDESQPMWGSSDVLSEDLDVDKAWRATEFRQEPTPTGTERFGLLEPTVVHYMQQLPRASSCVGYTFRDFAAPVAAAAQHNTSNRPGGILAAMKRGAEEVGVEEEMDIPGAWTETYSSRKKRKKELWGREV